MVQDQLVDYISSQMKLGVSRDAIRSALVSAGWLAADVDDTLKKIGAPAAAAEPASSAAVMSKPAMKTAEPQMIRVSDLVSSTPVSRVAVSTVSSAASSPMSSSASNSGMGMKKAAAADVAMGAAMMPAQKSKAALIAWIVAGVMAVGLGGLAWYFYSQNAVLAGQVTSLTSQSTSVNDQLTSLQSQVDASTTALSAQISSLTATNADLALNLSFYVAPGAATAASMSSSTTSTVPVASLPLSLKGWITASKGTYFLTTLRGGRIGVSGTTDPKIIAQLKGLTGSMAQLTGNYTPGTDLMTVTTAASSTSAN